MKKDANEQAAKVTREAATTVEETVLHSTKVSFGAEVTVQRVLARYKGCRVLIKNLPLTVAMAEVVTLFTQSGFDPTRLTVYPPRGSIDRSRLDAVVEFEDAVDGKNAIAQMDETKFGSSKLKLALISKRGGMEKSRGANSDALTVTWRPPPVLCSLCVLRCTRPTPSKPNSKEETFNRRKIETNIAQKPSNPPNIHWNPATISVSGLEPGTSSTSIEGFCGLTSSGSP